MIENKERLLEVLKDIQQDAENDAKSLDGMSFSGLTVGAQFGKVLASLNALAKIVEEIINNEK